VHFSLQGQHLPFKCLRTSKSIDVKCQYYYAPQANSRQLCCISLLHRQSFKEEEALMINCLIVLNCFEFYGYYFNHLDYSSIVSDSNLIFICYYDGYSRNSSLACFRNGHSLLQNYALCYDAITIDAEEGGALTPEQVRVTASKMKLNCLQGSKLLLKQQED
jgi:hypothetical protein